MVQGEVLEIIFLGSGSKGNATLLRWGETRILFDCGFSAKELNRRLAEFGEHLDKVDAICISHEHADHVGGLRGLGQAEGLRILATERTLPALNLSKRCRAEKEPIRPGRPFAVGPVEIRAFSTRHDARDPVGYRVGLPDGTRLALATDLGIPTDETIEALSGVDLLGLESNHDLNMLDQGPYPWVLKQRIRSDRGHLANPAAAALLERIGSERLSQVFAMHLSETNNRPALAAEALQGSLRRLGLKTGLKIIDQHRAWRFGRIAGQMRLF